MSACPACGAETLDLMSEQYERLVRQVDGDPDLRAALAPPTRRASIHGFILGTLVWITGLTPFFAPVGRVWKTTLYVLIPTLAWIPIFLHARREDARRLKAYQARRRCSACGHQA